MFSENFINFEPQAKTDFREKQPVEWKQSFLEEITKVMLETNKLTERLRFQAFFSPLVK